MCAGTDHVFCQFVTRTVYKYTEWAIKNRPLYYSV